MNDYHTDISKAIADSAATQATNLAIPQDSHFESVMVEHQSDKFYLQISVNKSEIQDSDLVEESAAEPRSPTTFFEAVGAQGPFKELFTELKRSTNLSKKEISQLLRKDQTLSFEATAEFNLYISTADVKSPQEVNEHP